MSEGKEGLKAKSVWHVECLDNKGRCRWKEDVENLIPNAGLEFILNKAFRAVAYTAGWFVGLKGAGVVLPSHTLAAHAGWSELTDYVGNRQATIFDAAVAGTMANTGSRPEFEMTAGITVHGMFLTDVATGSAGTLLSAVDFSAPRAVLSGDILRVSITYNLASA